MQIFVVGATGYIGGVIAENLYVEGHQILALARAQEEAYDLMEAGYEVVRGDLSDLSVVGQAAGDCDAMIYAASGSGPDWPQIERAALRMSIEAMKGTRHPLCFVGNSLVYGDTGPAPLPEDAPFRPPAFVAHRAALEQMLLDAAPHARTLLVHGSLVYGRGGGFVPQLLLDAARSEDCGHYIGRGDNRWSCCHVDDLADLVVRALYEAPAGCRLSAADTSPTMRDLAEAVSDSIGAAGRTRSITMEEARRFFGFYAEPLAMHQRFRCDNARALGWRPHRPLFADDLKSGYYALPSPRAMARMSASTTRTVPH